MRPQSTCRSDRLPPAIALLPRMAPLSFETGARPVIAAASPAVIRPSSGNSVISIAAETGPFPGIDGRRLALAVGYDRASICLDMGAFACMAVFRLGMVILILMLSRTLRIRLGW